MRRRWKILLGVLGVLAVLLAVNTVTTGSQTKEAEVTAEDGQILQLSRGAVQVTDSGPPAGDAGQPIVLIHCYACSLHWFDKLEPLLAERHRVIRVDLLGFGGSEKPESGYEIPAQAGIVAEALSTLGVQGALVAGNSMGGTVTASLAEQASQLVDRAVLIDTAPDSSSDFGDGLPFLAKLSYTPVLGEAMWRLTPDFAIRKSYEEAFAPGFDVQEAFEDPDQIVEDYRAMTYTSFDEASSASDDFGDELPLDERFKRTPVPLMVIMGAEDQIRDAAKVVEGFSDVPGVRTEVIEGVGHAPQIEAPEEVAALLEGFSVDPQPPSASDRRPSPNRQGDRQSKNRQRSDARPGGAQEERERRQAQRRKQNR